MSLMGKRRGAGNRVRQKRAAAGEANSATLAIERGRFTGHASQDSAPVESRSTAPDDAILSLKR
jgi:hypothetical protein